MNNQTRANAAGFTLVKYASIKECEGNNTEENVIDLLTDLLHFADVEGLSFGECLRIAESHYEHEVLNPNKE